MNKYIVLVREVHIQGHIVEALTPEIAKEVVRAGGGELDEAYFEYSHTLDPSLWTVEEKLEI
jgi:hypothetical protein